MRIACILLVSWLLAIILIALAIILIALALSLVYAESIGTEDLLGLGITT